MVYSRSKARQVLLYIFEDIIIIIIIIIIVTDTKYCSSVENNKYAENCALESVVPSKKLKKARVT